MSDVIVAPEVRDLDVLAQQLVGWLGAKMPAARDIVLSNLAYPFGAGQSHETILFDAVWTDDGGPREQGLVVRVKPRGHTVFLDDLFDEQYRVMRVLHENGHVRVARPLWLEHDPGVIGSPFFVMEKVRGRVAVSVPVYSESGWVFEATPEQRRKLWENGVRQLAATQRTPLDQLDFLKGPPGAEQGLEQEWDKFERFRHWLREDPAHPVLEEAAKRLEKAWPSNRPAGLVWGDARLGNMMFDDTFEVVAVMDWEQPSLGGALNDLAWWCFHGDVSHGATPTRAHLEGMGTRDETIALWGELTGIPTADVEWYYAFTALKWGCTGARFQKLKGWPPNPEQTRMLLKSALEF